MGDLVRTVIVDSTVFCRMPRSQVVDSRIEAGQVILALSSTGQASYEQSYNGGMGSNGLTSARHDIFSKKYAQKYPESYDPEVPEDLVYTGPHELTELHPELGIPLGKLVLSPTRTYLPVMMQVLKNYRDRIGALIHCTGGGQGKCLKFAGEQVHIIKDKLFPVPPLFSLIQSASGTEWEEMYQVFNMGHLLEIYTDEEAAKGIMEIAAGFGIEGRIIGRCEEAAQKKLTILSENGQFEFS